MELRLMRYFVAVAEELNFRRAADRLRMTQPPLSQAIRQLEQQLGVRLLDRDTHGTQLTPAGDAFLAGARTTLAQAERAVDDARAAARGVDGTLRLASTWSGSPGVCWKLVEEFRGQRPGVHVDVVQSYTADIVAKVRSGRFDVGVVRLPLDDATGLRVVRLTDEPAVLVVPEGHRLAGGRDVLAADVNSEPFVWFARWLAPGVYDHCVAALWPDRTTTPTIVTEELDDRAIMQAVAAGKGLGIAPAGGANETRPAGTAVASFAPTGPRNDLGLVTRRDAEGPIIGSFLATVGQRPPEVVRLDDTLLRSAGPGR